MTVGKSELEVALGALVVEIGQRPAGGAEELLQVSGRRLGVGGSRLVRGAPLARRDIVATGQGCVQAASDPRPGVRWKLCQHRVAAVASARAVQQADDPLVIAGLHVEVIVAEAPHEQALEASLLRVPPGLLAAGELAAGGIDPMDQIEERLDANLDTPREHVFRIRKTMFLPFRFPPLCHDQVPA